MRAFVLASLALVACSGARFTTAGDAGHDGASSVGGGDWCASQPMHTICADFDQGAVDAQWAKITVTGATLVADSTESMSPPNALHATFAPNASMPVARLERTFPSATGKVHCELSVDLDAYSSTSGDELGFLVFEIASTDYSYYNLTLTAGVSSATLIENGGPPAGDIYQTYSLSPVPTAGSWSKVAVDLASGQASLSVDDHPSLQTSLSMPQAITGVTVAVGALNGPPFAWGVHLDNVWCDIKP